MTAWSELERPSAILRRHAYQWVGRDCWKIWFICPGCKEGHAFNQQWSFDGNFERPTFSPSLLCTRPGKRCHSFVRDGQIQFFSDCDHELAGQTVPIPPWRDEDAFGRE